MDAQERQTLDALVVKYSLKEEKVRVGDTRQWRLTLPRLVFVSFEDRAALRQLGFHAPGNAKTWYYKRPRM